MPGRSPGLSAFDTMEQAFKQSKKAQGINVDRLAPPLQIFPDDPKLEGGVQGHVTIAPSTSDGKVDGALLGEWAATRKSGLAHHLTDILKAAIERPDIRRP